MMDCERHGYREEFTKIGLSTGRCQDCKAEQEQAREVANSRNSYVDFLSKRVEEVCAELGVQYVDEMTLEDALGSEQTLPKIQVTTKDGHISEMTGFVDHHRGCLVIEPFGLELNGGESDGV